MRGRSTGTIVNGTRFDDVLTGTDGDDKMRGGAGNDVLIGGRGNDVVLGQDGDDLLVWNGGDGSDAMEGGAGFDFVQVNGSNGAGDSFLVGSRGGIIVVRDQNSGDEISIASTEVIELNGLGGDDVIISTLGADAGVELHIDGGFGNDLLMADDTLDVIHGGFGNDWLAGGGADDEIYGDAGDDMIVWNDGDGNDRIEGGEGFDFVQVNGANTAGDYFRIDPNGERVLVQGNQDDPFTLDIGTVETLDVNAGGGDDVIIASDGLAGLIALDLDGGEGNDLLIGGDGVDVLRGGAGNDVLIGGRGNDIMLFEQGDEPGFDLMADFEFGSDAIAFGDGFLAEGDLDEVLSVVATDDDGAMLWANTTDAGWTAIAEFDAEAATVWQALAAGDLVDTAFIAPEVPDFALDTLVL